jgi:hypothetical protein
MNSKWLNTFSLLVLLVLFTLVIQKAFSSDYKVSPEERVLINQQSPGNMVFSVGNKIENSLNAGKPFRRTVTLTTTTATTEVEVVAATEAVNARIYVNNIRLKVNGSTAWAPYTAGAFTKLSIKSSTPTVAEQIAISSSALSGNAFLLTSSTGVTLNSPVQLSTGTPASQNLAVVANSSVTAGSPIHLTIDGVIY